MPHLWFATPAKGHLEEETEASLQRCFARLRELGVGYTDHREPSPGMELARNLIAAHYLERAPEDSRLVCYDSDVWGFTAEDVLRMARSGEDVIGGPVPGRSFEPPRIANAIKAGVALDRLWSHASPLLMFAKGEGAEYREDDALLEIEAIGLGFMMTTKHAIRTVGASSWTASYAHDTIKGVFNSGVTADGKWIGEDIAFCWRWRHAGGRVWADTEIALRHVGRASFFAPPLKDVLHAPFAPKTFRSSTGADITIACPIACESTARSVISGEYDLPIAFDAPPTVLDLGANVGAFARWAIDRWPGATVHAYEPQPKMLEALQRNLVDGMRVHDTAVVPTIAGGAPLRLYVGRRNPCTASVTPLVDETERDAIAVAATDALVLPDADVLKIDVEGNEAAILQRYLSVPRPRLRAVAIEHHSAADAEALTLAILPENGFRVVQRTPYTTDIGIVIAVREEVHA